MFIKGFKDNFDKWSLIHFLGPYFLCDFFPFGFVILSVVGWEIMDIIWSRIRSYFSIERIRLIDNIWDYRGASWGDLVLGALAILIWIFKHKLF